MSAAVSRQEEEAPLRAALAAGDVERVRAAVQRWAEAVRAAADPEEASRLAEALHPVARHANGKIRQIAGEAADALPDGAFDSLLGALSADPDHYVRAAMKLAARRRAARRTVRAKLGEQERLVADLLDQMERQHGKAARRLAERAVRRGTESFVRKLHHEALKVVTPLEFALNRLHLEVTRPEPDRAALAHNVAVARERHSFLWAVIDRAREATTAVTPRFGEHALRPLIEDARTQLVERMGPRSDRLAFAVDVDATLHLDVDRTALLQALQNFFQNAVEAYAADAARIDIAVSARALRAGSQIEVRIVDRGEGMTEEQKSDLFIPFGSRKPGGTGVGLVIARTMIEEVHGGTLGIESARGEGTTVKLVLPAHQGRKGGS